MGRYRQLLFAVGAVVAFAIALVLLRRRRRACPNLGDFQRLRSRWLDVALIAFAITYGAGRFVLSPHRTAASGDGGWPAWALMDS
jgi:hypothetical protein